VVNNTRRATVSELDCKRREWLRELKAEEWLDAPLATAAFRQHIDWLIEAPQSATGNEAAALALLDARNLLAGN